MAELICIGVTAGIAGAGELFLRKPSAESVPRYSEHMRQLEQSLLKLRSETQEKQHKERQKAKAQGPNKDQMKKIQKAAQYHGIDLNHFGVSSQDKVSGDLPKRMQNRQVMNIGSSDPYHFNRSELDGNIAIDSSTQMTYEQATARNDEQEAVNRRYYNEQQGMMFNDGMAEHEFDGEQSHYGSSGMVPRPNQSFPTKQGQMYGSNSTYADGDLIAPVHVAKGPQIYESQSQRTQHGDGHTQVSLPPQRRVNPRQQHPSNIKAPDTISSQRPETDWYEQNVSEEQVNRMIRAPSSSTHRANQDLYEQVRSEAEVERLMASQNHMNTIVAKNKASMTAEADSNFKFYTDSGNTQQAQPSYPQRQPVEVHPQHNIQTIDLSETVSSGQQRGAQYAEVDSQRYLNTTDQPIAVMQGGRKNKVYAETHTNNTVASDFTTTTVSETVQKRSILGQQLLNDERRVLGDDTIVNTVDSGLVTPSKEQNSV